MGLICNDLCTPAEALNCPDGCCPSLNVGMNGPFERRQRVGGNAALDTHLFELRALRHVTIELTGDNCRQPNLYLDLQRYRADGVIERVRQARGCGPVQFRRLPPGQYAVRVRSSEDITYQLDYRTRAPAEPLTVPGRVTLPAPHGQGALDMQLSVALAGTYEIAVVGDDALCEQDHAIRLAFEDDIMPEPAQIVPASCFAVWRVDLEPGIIDLTLLLRQTAEPIEVAVLPVSGRYRMPALAAGETLRWPMLVRNTHFADFRLDDGDGDCPGRATFELTFEGERMQGSRLPGDCERWFRMGPGLHELQVTASRGAVPAHWLTIDLGIDVPNGVNEPGTYTRASPPFNTLIDDFFLYIYTPQRVRLSFNSRWGTMRLDRGAAGVIESTAANEIPPPIEVDLARGIYPLEVELRGNGLPYELNVEFLDRFWLPEREPLGRFGRIFHREGARSTEAIDFRILDDQRVARFQVVTESGMCVTGLEIERLDPGDDPERVLDRVDEAGCPQLTVEPLAQGYYRMTIDSDDGPIGPHTMRIFQ